jgi:hypothetical protein
MDNMLLIPSGCALSERQIDVLNAWGIPEVQVQATDEPEEPTDILQRLPPETLAKIKTELEGLFFEPLDKNPIQEEVVDLILRRRARELLGKPA